MEGSLYSVSLNWHQLKDFQAVEHESVIKDVSVLGHIGCDSFLCLLNIIKAVYEMNCRGRFYVLHVILLKVNDCVDNSAC